MQNYNLKIKTPGSRFRGNDIYPVRLSRSTLGFTLWELVCVIFVIALLFALLMPSLSKVKRISTRVVCGTNLKGLGTAMVVYANDYEGRFPELPGEGPWSRELGFVFDMAGPDFARGGAQANVGRTISASWYLLVREADVSPKSFVCPESDQEPFGGRYSPRHDITELWDFGDDPYMHVSYSMHNPYGEFPADGTRSAGFAVAADMSPWFKDGNIVPPGRDGQAPQLIMEYWTKKLLKSRPMHQANSWNHGGGAGRGGEGQNVLFGDGHTSYEKLSDVGVKHDGIYTYWQAPGEPTEAERRIGKNPTGRGGDNDAKGGEDSFLGI
jgi:prepilin-type processing-associated H-X9-DG protein